MLPSLCYSDLTSAKQTLAPKRCMKLRCGLINEMINKRKAEGGILCRGQKGKIERVTLTEKSKGDLRPTQSSTNHSIYQKGRRGREGER